MAPSRCWSSDPRPGGAPISGTVGPEAYALWRAARFRSARELRRLVEGAGLGVESVTGAVYFPPSALPARILAPLDSRLARRTTLGAAFIAVTGVKAS